MTTKVGLDATRPMGDAFPTRADLPFDGFEDMKIDDYLQADDFRHVSDLARNRRQMEE